jgi:hypothetical protein
LIDFGNTNKRVENFLNEKFLKINSREIDFRIFYHLIPKPIKLNKKLALE